MYHLQLFDLDVRGRPTGPMQMSDLYRFLTDAIQDARRLRLATHFRITDQRGQTILEDRLPAVCGAQAVD